MFGHFPELLIILTIGFIVFGPEKLPEVAANAGRLVREARQFIDETLNQNDTEVADDFSTYYYESLARSGEDVPTADDGEEFYQDAEPYEPDPEYKEQWEAIGNRELDEDPHSLDWELAHDEVDQEPGVEAGEHGDELGSASAPGAERHTSDAGETASKVAPE